MTRITYIPPEGDAAECRWGKYLFKANVPLEVSDRHIIAKAGANPHFEVEAGEGASRAAPAPQPERGKPDQPKPEKPKRDSQPGPKAEGFAAARDGKSDAVPKAYRGKPEETLWVEGFMAFDKTSSKENA
jgi:hypothetical protein